MQKKALLYIILAGMFWGTSGLFVATMTPMGLSPIQITAVRAIVSGVFMVCYALGRDRSLFKASKKELALYSKRKAELERSEEKKAAKKAEKESNEAEKGAENEGEAPENEAAAENAEPSQNGENNETNENNE